MTIFGWTMEEWACAFYYDKRDHSCMSLGHALDVRREWMKRGFHGSPLASSIVTDEEQPKDWIAAVALFEVPAP